MIFGSMSRSLSASPFLGPEQFLQRHHCHRALSEHRLLIFLVLIADGIHNFVDGSAAAAALFIELSLPLSIESVAHFPIQRFAKFTSPATSQPSEILGPRPFQSSE